MQENMSNALMMAGGVFLGILLVTLVVITFFSSANFARNYEEKIEGINLEAFNRQFEIYQVKERDITIQDIISVGNLAKDINEKNEITDPKSDYYLKVTLSGTTVSNPSIERNTEEQRIELIKDYSLKSDSSVQKFSCTDIKYSEKINIKKATKTNSKSFLNILSTPLV